MRKYKMTAFALALSLMFTTNAFAKEVKKSDEYTYMDKIFGYAAELYVDESLTKEEILDRALDKYLKENPDAVVEILKAGFSQIDDYTEYYTAEELEDYVNSINHTFYGIGVIIQKNGDYIEITNVMEDGGAYYAGVTAGDKISKVDGKDMKYRSVDEVQSAVVGEINTNVDITFIRGTEEFTVSIIRRPVSATTVSNIPLENGVAYVSVINFANGTAEEFSNTLNELKEQNIDKIILDLRDNPGGYLVSAVDIARMIVPEGIIVQTMFRQSENNITYYSDLKNPEFKFVVLVNENTASAAEILTGAIQDSGIGTVIGTTTYGKGVIQDIFNMRNDDSFKITTGRYLTRNGREINKKGLDPDIEVLNISEPIDVKKYREIEYKTDSSFGDELENVSVIKERLAVLGYYIPDTSNEFNDALEAAVLDFQINHELTPTGKLDRITMVQIENAFAKCEVMTDYQLYKAYEYFGGTREGLEECLKK